jgi:diadenosine tetraphosphate (Ap4A) HIT family hydrolase
MKGVKQLGIRRLSFSLAQARPLGFAVGFIFAHFPALVPAKTLIVTDEVISFYHPVPYYKKHVVVVPKKVVGGMMSVRRSSLLENVLDVSIRLSREVAWDNKIVVLCVNGGKRQRVGQLHFHIHSVEAAMPEEFLEKAKSTKVETSLDCDITLKEDGERKVFEVSQKEGDSKKLFGSLPKILKTLNEEHHFKKSGFSVIMRLYTESHPALAIDKIYIDVAGV